ncbi:hypothetical protein TNCT_66701 [Trichonephila clavata]|uniref:Uncharacterized protein n=1 Tax=Trichonephila clavata TaxID=2740835 RepID=A0A8X6K9I3_TRICU|nr:hypothetical protein TNCT_66701 [Trichonephila clavata]
MAYPCVNAADCKEEFNKVKRTVNAIMESDEAPECVKQYNEEFKEYLGGISEQEQEAVLVKRFPLFHILRFKKVI